MNKDMFTEHRKSYMELGSMYFWTATINNWNQLLKDDEYKEIIVGSLRYLSAANKIDVFAFVIMPNHVHLLWRAKVLNGKETPQGSFLKYTAHEFKKLIKIKSPESLTLYAVQKSNKSYEFWQRDPMATKLYSPEVAYQKMDYTHYNPCTERWKLASDPCDYLYSTARFYMGRSNQFDFVKDIRQEL